MKISILLAILAVSCGDINIEDNGNGNVADVDVEVDEETEETEPEETKTVTTTTTTTTTTVTGEEEESDETVRVSKVYELVNDNPVIVDFIGSDYCSGISFRDCYLGSAVLREYDNGVFKISFELKDSFEDNLVKVKKTVTDENRAVLLFDDAKIADDDSAPWKKLWAVLNLEEMSLEIVYDYVGAGPGDQGTETLDLFYFVEQE